MQSQSCRMWTYPELLHAECIQWLMVVMKRNFPLPMATILTLQLISGDCVCGGGGEILICKECTVYVMCGCENAQCVGVRSKNIEHCTTFECVGVFNFDPIM